MRYNRVTEHGKCAICPGPNHVIHCRFLSKEDPFEMDRRELGSRSLRQFIVLDW